MESFLEKIKDKNKRYWRTICISNEQSLLDILVLSKEPIYLNYSFSSILVDTFFCRLCNFPVYIGYEKGRFVAHTCSCKKNSSILESLKTLFSDDKSLEIYKEYCDFKTNSFTNKKMYWINKGFSEEESTNKVKEKQKEISIISASKNKGKDDISPRQFGFWVKKGLSEEEAKFKVKKNQTTNGLEFYIKKYGEEGKILFEKRIEKWMSTLLNKSNINEINQSKGKKKEYFIDLVGLGEWIKKDYSRVQKMLSTKIGTECLFSNEEFKERFIYYSSVKAYTRFSIRNYYGIINPNNLKIGPKDNHIDHVFSIFMGFLNKVPPEIIGSAINLRVIPYKENLDKGLKSNIKIEELTKLYEEFKNKNG